MKVLIYLEEEKLAPKGGPLAVGYYYNQEMKERGEHTFDFLHSDLLHEEFKRKGRDFFSKCPTWLRSLQQSLHIIYATNKFLSGEAPKSRVDFSKYDLIQFHDTQSMFKERAQLEIYKGIVCLQSHSPIPLGQELCSDMPQLAKLGIPNIDKRYEKMDKYAFDRADYIIFPCPEAEEPYAENWPYFNELKKRKSSKFRYVLTGIYPCLPRRERQQVLKELSIPHDSFLISYVGRHNMVKGYDILKEISAKYFSINPNAWVVSAGKEEPFTRLQHPHWKEIGFTSDAHSYIASSDVFILPNRVTYFDIVMLEILSLGTIVIASRTGGNKFFEKKGVKGVLLYNTVEEALQLLDKVYRMSDRDRDILKNSNREFFHKNLSVSAMYDNYNNVIKDFGCI